jgi:hypothetical protein
VAPQLTNGAAIDRVEHQVIDEYEIVTQGVTPYLAKLGDKVYTFNRRPNAKLMVRSMRMLGQLSEGLELSPKSAEVIGQLVDDLQMLLAAMLAPGQNIDELMDLLDLEPLAELAGKAMEKMTARPTTGSSDSGVSAPTTTPATGSPALGSPQPISTG